ncbi:MAG: DUF2723 domain-containing protein [Flavobacteriales bacterium]|nr:DUF2723 domain-containing protein [Flavobacteriales bacterium]MBK9076725.1 DUF2723 domain-containing protein [Flavobacteriales bacterium]MBK9538139.1 DUF2723 domain-containing protein [Flavobacteriales bacterium]
MDFKKLNIVTGWLVFLVATYTYIATIEPTASFWDCGEFIATANKLEVGHPPGAPLFMMIARVFSAFVSPENVPVSMNVLSALCSSFSILFLFWSITHLALKLAVRKGDEELTTGKLIAVIGSGVVGALAYTWSDSFWFSAVEAEVYSMSSLFTALVFWAILKWESEADQPHNTRWLILICYLIGLSIGVQLLGLLCIPAIALVYYFKKYTTTTKGVIYTLVIGALILGTIQAIIIPGIVKVAGTFELLFVNDFGLPFNTGNFVYGALLIALIVWGLMWSQRSGRVVLNTIILGVTVIILGYSTYAMIVIRSTANPPIDENNPENVFNLVSYLNREQYGDRPLLMGQFWDSELSSERGDGTPVYTATWLAKKDGKTAGQFYDRWTAQHWADANPGGEVDHAYIMTDPRKGSEPVYEPEFTMVFPRMYSSQASHVEQYKSWSNFKGTPIRTTDREGKPTIIYKPTFGENMRFFVDYQVNWMYWRYFLWNFAGRQNDIQGHGNIIEGNWLTGIPAIDSQRLGNQETLPPSMTANKGFNKLYLLPLLLGAIGLIYQLMRNLRDWTVVMLLFFFTGAAIVIYLNQTPYQPRERDYAYVGSFYAFAIWIGLGVYALFEAARSITQREILISIGAAAGLGVLKYLVESVADDDHAVSYSIFYLTVLSGAGLGLFHVLGKVVKGDTVPAALASLLCLLVPLQMVRAEWDDHDRSTRMPARDLASDYLNSCAPNAILFTNGDNDTFPLWYAQEVEGIRTDIRIVNLSLLNTDWYADQMRRKAYDSEPLPFGLAQEKYRQGTRDIVALIPSQNEKGVYVDVKQAMNFVANDRNMQPLFQRNTKDAYFPTNKFRIPVDSAHVVENGTVALQDTALIVDNVDWEVRKQILLKNQLMVLDLLANFNWDRPIYFAVTTGPDSYLNLQNYFQLEGLTYRLVPIYTKNENPNLYGRVGTDVMFDNVMNKFRWGNMESEGDIYLDENILRMTTNLRLQLSSLADALTEEGRKDDARAVLDLTMEKMPERNVPFDRIMLPVIESYYKAGDTAKANQFAERLFTVMEENLAWYVSLEPKFADKISNDMAIAHAVMDRLVTTARALYGQKEFADSLKDRMDAAAQAYEAKMMELEGATPKGRRTTKGRF